MIPGPARAQFHRVFGGKICDAAMRERHEKLSPVDGRVTSAHTSTSSWQQQRAADEMSARATMTLGALAASAAVSAAAAVDKPNIV
jgi:hypothetical protein